MYQLFVFYFFALGAIFGSFLSCLAWRLYQEKSAWPASRCDSCGRHLKWFENIPVLSYLALRGRCSSCHKKISWQYFAAEVFGGLLFAAAFLLFFRDQTYFSAILPSWRQWLEISLQLLSLAVLFFVMIYDGRYYLVSVPFVLGSALLIFLISLGLGVSWFMPLITAAIGGAFFLIQYLLTKKKGIGEGDIYLGILLGFIFPDFAQLACALVLSYVVGAVCALTLIAFGQKKLSSRLPLGFFLALGGMATVLFGTSLLNWYLGLL